MKLIKILLLILIFISTANAKEQYSKEHITKHLETLFTKHIRYEENTKHQRYIPFSNTIKLYYTFSSSIKNQKEKIEILKEVAKTFEKVIKLKIELKAGRPDITLAEQNGKLNTIYNTKDSLYEEHIYFDFANKEDVFSKVEYGFWNKKFFLGRNPTIYQKYMKYMNKENELSLGHRNIQSIEFKETKGSLGTEKNGKSKQIPVLVQVYTQRLKNFRLLEVSRNRDENFGEFVTKEIYLSLLPNATKLNVSNYIQPSTINKREDDYVKGEISWFDWIVLEEFYTNKKLKKYMFYKTEVIPMITEKIYSKVQRKVK